VEIVAASGRYVPAGHETQVLEASAAEYFPAPQTTQPAPFAEKYPAGQTVQELEEKHEEPAAHETVQVPVQTLAVVAPDTVLYLPASQTVQSATSSCKDAREAASALYLPGSQDVHSDMVVVL
jgi:hypothetical protein